MNNSVATANAHDSSNTRLDESGRLQNKSQQHSGWQNTSQQSLALLTPLQIISLASNSEKDTSQNNISYQFLAPNDSSFNTSKQRAAASANPAHPDPLNQSKASQRARPVPSDSAERPSDRDTHHS